MPAPELFTLYEGLKAAGERQLATLAADDQEGFAQASEDRESLFLSIQAREGELPRLPARTRAYVRELIQAILAMDTELQDALSAAAQRTLDELSALQSGLQALQSYGPDGEAPAYYIDRSG